MNKKYNCLSLFSGAGIGETYFGKAGIDVIVANELLSKRARLYSATHKDTVVVQGDITKKETVENIDQAIDGRNIDIILASPPCQGFSVAGKNRNQASYSSDPRNYLFLSVTRFIDKYHPDFVIFENVPSLLKFKIFYQDKLILITDFLTLIYGSQYELDFKILDSADYGVPQHRKRAIIKMWKKGRNWPWPKKSNKKITVFEAIGNLPSLESGESSNIKWHFARKHSPNNIECMKHTPTGHSAFENVVYFPTKQDGTKVKGYMSSYRRIKWDEPSPTITIRNDCISSQRNVHPGRLLSDGTYSDARVLTPLELMILDSLPTDWPIPDDTPEILIRQCIGESIPPKMLFEIVKEIDHE